MADSLGVDAWWGEPEYKVCGTFKTRGYFILARLHKLDSARLLAVTADLYKEPEDITKGEWKGILEHMGAGPEEIKSVQVKMGKWQ